MSRFIPEPKLEAIAADLWRRHALSPGFDVERLTEELGLSLLWDEIEDGDGGAVLGQFIPRQKLVVLNERHIDRLEQNGGRLGRFTLAHEIGHALLHAQHLSDGSLFEGVFDGERTWCRDGAREPVERQAEMFAAALLIPRDELRVCLPDGPWEGWPRVYRLADHFGVNVTPMRIRLERLGWIHLKDGVPRSGLEATADQPPLFGA